MSKTSLLLSGALLLLIPLLSRAQHVDTLRVGDQIPYFHMSDTSGHMMSLQHLKGSYVFIDVWASWCFPCIREYPHMAELEKKMEGKNIIFIGISCDDVNWRWRGAMGGYRIKGNQWIMKDKAFMKAFKVDRIPRYILLDKEGRIVELHALRPSDPELEKYLNNLTEI